MRIVRAIEPRIFGGSPVVGRHHGSPHLGEHVAGNNFLEVADAAAQSPLGFVSLGRDFRHNVA